MKLNILSDLHLSVSALEVPRNDADLVVLAGDIARPAQAIAWTSALRKPVLYVPGNHEFYGRDILGTVAELRRLSAGSQILILDNDEAIVGGVRFLGTTLWTDFMLVGPDERDAALQHAKSAIYDFRKIRGDGVAGEPFSPEEAAALFERNTTWLRDRLAEGHAGPTVVITHHAPSPRSIAPQFAGSLANAAFVSDVEHLMDRTGVTVDTRAHTHQVRLLRKRDARGL